MRICIKIIPTRTSRHLRTWNGKSWSDAVIIPFDTGGFNDPIFLRHGSDHLCSVGLAPRPGNARVYSELGADAAWSFPVPLCPARDGRGGCSYFAGLHVDQRGCIHAAWCQGQETFAVMAGKLGQ